MGNLRTKWLLWRGFKPIRFTRVKHYWESADEGAPTSVTTVVTFRKGISIKKSAYNSDVSDELYDIMAAPPQPEKEQG